jgi:hypothetical protein
MKHTLVFAIVFLLLVTIGITKAHAHELQKSGTVEVELHVDPDDSPMESSDSHMGFEVVDSTKRFDIARCQCLLTIKKGSFVFSELEISELEVPFIFPEDGDYHVVLKGWPKRGFSFTPFTVTFPVKVLPRLAKPTVAPKVVDVGSINIYVALAILLILILLSVFVNSRSRR